MKNISSNITTDPAKVDLPNVQEIQVANNSRDGFANTTSLEASGVDFNSSIYEITTENYSLAVQDSVVKAVKEVPQEESVLKKQLNVVEKNTS